ncbi:hypothetical protein SAMN05421734_105140 [Pelagirhabdus alkalitolerans]|uniref:Uncharacterized protein n=1 Tax=Pelagirhabdus alkalitolerans TaxID=1612202 RepID=A0A1G6JTM0_9BACI|nr:hypothetical protein [Pelagirhabdus alkalitolerans]SDC22064.1 hypothetical protein SAMN05421734_105140 [Pelagirhabdus alkalitolerans]
MQTDRKLVFAVLIVYLLVLQYYFFTEQRDLLHLLLGIAITSVTISRYRQLKQKNRSSKAHLTLIVVYFVVYTIVIWYIQPFFAYIMT